MGSGIVLLLFLSRLISAVSGGGAPSVELWCVAKNNADDLALQSAIDWACGPGGANCAPIQIGGPCYDSSNLPRMASYAFNDYFIKNGLTDDSCNFSNTAALTSLNPSYKNCKFPSSFSKGNMELNGSVTAGQDSTSNNSNSRRWDRSSISILLFFASTLLIL
ncbi:PLASMODESMATA CALLOSE-BINDING protein 5 [Dorcoceras hygrometricum]|uniref:PLASMODESMATA CALLOSE-BINDING protein 5 n=1 Tax=Dorcoceras hygrometricum TaxID=472368 RepID=A0A2Z7D033_9LAMI|nr:PLASMODESMATA CALLOSE-BINDING protein 5 [Dorcoceras hygrometricum]